MDAATHTVVYPPSAGASAVVYQELKSWILLGRVPIGIPLRTERLAERMGCSRTPAREAMLRLAAERFLEPHPHGGLCVAAPRVQTMRELYEVRRALELFAIRRGFDSEAGHDLDLLGRVHEEWSTLADDGVAEPSVEFVLLDEAFHGTLADAAGNASLADDLRRVNERIRPVRSHDFLTDDRIAVTIDQHLGILGAVLAGAEDASALALDEHIRESQEVVESRVGAALERMLANDEAALW